MSTAAPVAAPERISSLDTLRGFALLGILVMNIWAFAMPMTAYFNPGVYGDLSGANWWSWLLSHLLFDQKFMTIFSMLFGAGILLFTERAEARGARPARLHYRRMLWLLLFGILHGYLLWFGDILYLYAVCGMVVYPLRKKSPRTLLVTGGLVISVASLFFLLSGRALQGAPQQVRDEFIAENWSPPPEKIQEELAAYRGGWVEQVKFRALEVFFLQTAFTLLWGLWRAGGLMLVGMALYKLGVFSAARSGAVYAAMLAIGLAAGLPVVYRGVLYNEAGGWEGIRAFFFGTQFNYWGSLLVSAGWVGMVMLACRSRAWDWLTGALGAVGRMAFTNYLLHTIICTTIFYGHGFGLFGRLERAEQVLVVLGVWAVQLIASPIWLRHFQFGPFEWLWRSLTYGAAQPFRRTAPSATPAS